MTNSLRDLGAELAGLKKAVRALQTKTQLANSSIEDGAVRDYEGDSLMAIIGRQYDGTHVAASVNGPNPPRPSIPIVTAVAGGAVVEWDGLFHVPTNVAPMDFARTDIHTDTTADFEEGPDTIRNSFSSPRGGRTFVPLAAGTHYVKLVTVSMSGKLSEASVEVSVLALPPASSGTDGEPPEDAPVLTAIEGYASILYSWTAPPNNDPLRYRLHLSRLPDFINDDSGDQFVPDTYDDFQTDSLAVKWPGSYNGTLLAGGRVQMTSAPGLFAGIDTDPLTFDLTDSDITAKIEASATPGATQQYGMSANYDTDNRFIMFRPGNATQVTCRVRVGGSNTDTTASADSTMIYWRIRNTPGEVFFYVSPDREIWTELASTPHALTTETAAMSVDISVGDTDAGSVLEPLTIWADDVSSGVVAAPDTFAMEGPQTRYTLTGKMPDGTELGFDTIYAQVIALDDDGPGPASNIVAAAPRQGDSEFMAVGTIINDHLVSNVIDADKLATRIAMASTFLAGSETGAHLEFGEEVGQRLYGPDGQVLIDFPIDGVNLPRINSELITQGLTSQGNLTIAGGDTNEIATDTSVTMSSSVSAPLQAPIASVSYDSVLLPQISRAGPLGTFALNPAEVTFMGRNPEGWLEIYQQRPGGTRKWYYTVEGEPFAPYFGDWVGYEVVGETYPDNTYGRGVALMRQMSNNQWIINVLDHGIWNTYHPYSETSGSPHKPIIGTKGGQVFVAETIPFAAGPTFYARLSVKTLTFNTTTNFADVSVSQNIGPADLVFDYRLAGALHGQFDLGIDRFMIGTLGAGHNFWAISNGMIRDADSDWESPSTNRRGFCWDPDAGRFLSLGGDGKLYTHTDAIWGAADSSKWWIGETRYNLANDYETPLGAKRTITAKRRAKLSVDFEPLPDFGGAGDPDNRRVYIGRGATEPINSQMFFELEGDFTAAQINYVPAFSGDNPPTTSNFPGANPGRVRSAAVRADLDPKFEAKGDGSGRWGAVLIGADQKVQIEAGYRLYMQGHEGWTNLTLQNSWQVFSTATYGPARFRLAPDGWVELAGAVTHAGTPATFGLTIATLPLVTPGVRPVTYTWMQDAYQSDPAEKACRIFVTTAGAIGSTATLNATATEWLILSGIRFPTF
jgi:hypothetical protein